MKIRTIIADDEPLARERIRTLLRAEADVEVLAECGDGDTALEALREHAPDLLFLDIQMPGKDGFEVLRELGANKVPVVIFVTAFDRHALKAFEVHALDYLLKPFKQARFQQTVQRARELLAARQAGTVSQSLMDFLAGQQQCRQEHVARFAVKTGERTIFVKADQVDYVESAGNYVVLHTAKENHVLRETLSALEEQLDPKKFLRISRSTIVNLDQVKELQPLFKGDHAVVLHTGKQLTMTRGIREVQKALRFGS